MAFRLYSTDDGRVPAWEYLPCEALRPRAGLCLNLDSASGQLEVSKTPGYVCMREEEATVAAGTLIPVVKIQKDQIWESELDGATTLGAGAAIDVDTTGLFIDGDASTDKVFLLTAVESTDAGATVRGRFVK
ncbi:MAG: hypothetical protein ACI3W6_07325 [Clostridia bacterium]